MSDEGRYIRYRNKLLPCARCRKPHGVLAMRFSMERAVEDAAERLRDEIDEEVLRSLRR